jgi:S-adenosylmethionine synthetase
MFTSGFISSEGVGEGHPDKVADYISDSILDACLAQDPDSRVACETLVKSNCVVLAGEISTRADVSYEAVVREAIRSVGYIGEKDVFCADGVFISNWLTRQSPEISNAVSLPVISGKSKSVGAGDQGFFFGYACNETPEYLPAPYVFAQKLCEALSRPRKEGQIRWLRPDAKSLVTMRYEETRPVEVENIVISTQHDKTVSHKEIEAFCRDVLVPGVIPDRWLHPRVHYVINPGGPFVQGGPAADCGLTGRKIIVDTYGGVAHHGGGAFSGKDASKVDRSAAYFCRWVAKNIVAAGLAHKVEVRLAYVIGGTSPIHYDLTTFGTEQTNLEHLKRAIPKVFDASMAGIIEALDLRVSRYRKTTLFGHFTKPSMPWEQINRVEALRACCGR